jgi:hypothetical protein
MVAAARRLWEMADERMPTQAALIQACVAQSGPKGYCLGCAYDQMEEANFSRAVLENAAELGVVRARGCGFSDWDRPSGSSNPCEARRNWTASSHAWPPGACQSWRPTCVADD